MSKLKTIPRDISWLGFNARVLQEAADVAVPLHERIRFLGIFSNNLDEFFRVRVATLKRMLKYGYKAGVHLETAPAGILEQIQDIVAAQQIEFENTWLEIQRSMKKQGVSIIPETKLSKEQKKFVLSYFSEYVQGNIVPLMIEDMPQFPVLNDKSIYLACTLTNEKSTSKKFALVSVPARRLPRFILLPSLKGKQQIILLEDIIRFCLPQLFSFFGYTKFTAHIIKVTRDAEIDVDNDIATSLIQKIEKGIKNRKKGSPVRFVFDKDIDKDLLNYLIVHLGLTKKDNLMPGGRIHNFKDFIKFPTDVFTPKKLKFKPFVHKDLQETKSISDVIFKKDILLTTPYHSFNSIIDLLREAAIDPSVKKIMITCYRLAERSKIINALTNAVRNGKIVTVVLELRARFDEEANIDWKYELEEAGVNVLFGVPNMKVHAKLCLISKVINQRTLNYGFVGTGNLNERTAAIYTDYFLLTSNKLIMADVNRIFKYLEQPKTNLSYLKQCKKLLVTPVNMRLQFLKLIKQEIAEAKKGMPATIRIKLNSLSDSTLIALLHDAALAGVKIEMIIRGICCFMPNNKKYKIPVHAISVVDEYLEHARVVSFYNKGKELVFISSADWMVRNLDHRIEVACPINNKHIKEEIFDMFTLQLNDNSKARLLDNEISNKYQLTTIKKTMRSQHEIHAYLIRKLSTKD